MKRNRAGDFGLNTEDGEPLYTDKKVKESLIGKRVKIKYGFPLHNEIFEIIGERKKQIEVQGDFSAGTHNVIQSEWVDKKMIKKFITK